MVTDRREGLTDEQHQAVTTRDISVALSAGAGCGKTFVLTERFLAQLQPHPGHRTRLGSLIAITFTERAAREMRERIRKACRRRVLDAPADTVDHWMNLVRQLDMARISTIHSFCGSLLRSHSVEAGLDPRFTVLEQAQADTLRHELINDELRDLLSQNDDNLIDLIVRFGLGPVREKIATLLSHRQEIDWHAWCDVTPETLVDRWKTYLQEIVRPSVLRAISSSTPARELLRIIEEHVPDHAVMQKRCAVLSEQLVLLPESDDPVSALHTVRENAKVQGGGGKKVWPSEDIYERFKQTATLFRKTIDAVRIAVTFDAESAQTAAEAGLRLLELAGRVERAYETRKEQLAALDFDDLLIRTQRLLTGPDSDALRRQLSSQTSLLLVDEFQDTDPLQAELVEAITGKEMARGKLFFVGDFKQSIYRFRGANPHVFTALRQKIPKEGRMPLTLNFRSQPAILDFVNSLFADSFRPNYERLSAFRPQVGPLPSVEMLWVPDEHPDVRTGQSQRIRRREADWIARRIRQLLASDEQMIYDAEASRESGNPTARTIRPGDVAILFRALSDVQHYEDALKRYGIDYYLVGGHAFYAQQEVFDLLNLLRSLASSCDEVSLAGVLRSPMFSLDDETLFWLAEHPEGLNAGLTAPSLPGELSEAQSRRALFAATTLGHLRQIKDQLPVAELVQRALSITGYDASILAEFLGERKLANLRKLIDQARSLDRSGIFSLSDFITQLTEFVAREPKEPLAATHPESTNVVRLMTVHQSKGLEFPVVIVADVDRPRLGVMSSAAFTSELGPVVKMPHKFSGFELYAQQEDEEDQAEQIRLFYVATTRAADYLILSSGLKEIGSTQGPWTELLAERFDLITGELLAELPEGYSVPKVKVTTSEPPLKETAQRSSRRNLSKLAEQASVMARQDRGHMPPYLGPIHPDRTARRQFSFSRLSGALHAKDPPSPEIPDESDIRPRLDPLGLGTLVHDVLEQIDFACPVDPEPLVRRLAEAHLPQVSDLSEPLDLIHRFLASSRAAQIASARRVHPEIEFLLAWPPNVETKADANGPYLPGFEPHSVSNGSYLQGFIDMLYEDADGWHLLDYKTNRVTASTLDAVATGYEMQMLVYALSVERIVGKAPVELVLAFLRPGLEYRFDWNESARHRVVELVDEGLRAAVEVDSHTVEGNRLLRCAITS